jgi:tetratricopeptide (TPR) repeat protein
MRIAWSCLLALAVTACAARVPPATTAAPPAGRSDTVALSIEVAKGRGARGDFAGAATVLDDALAGVRGNVAAEATLLAVRGKLAGQEVFGNMPAAEAARAVLDRARRAAEAARDNAALASVLDSYGALEYAMALNAGRGYERARPWLTQALAMREGLGDQAAIAETLFHLGLTYEQEGKDAEARPRYQRSLELATAAGDEVQMSYALRHLAGYIAQDGDPEKALEYHRRCLALRIKNGHVRFAAYAMIAIGDGERAAKRDAIATALYQQAFALAEAQGNRAAVMASRVALAGVDERAGRHDQAIAHYRAASELATALGDAATAAEIRTALDRLASK